MIYDLVVIGGGINGAGIARDAAGRGLSVLLVEKDDLAQATSSSSTKLIHGGLRYLEQYDFKLVRESLGEREDLLRAAPHIIWPMEFVLPHEPHLRPAWLIRLGLYLYDFLGKRDILPGSKGLSLRENKAGAALKAGYKRGFSYADCWVEDARLVVLCAMDAREKGAEILTRTECVSLSVEGNIWSVGLHDKARTHDFAVQARCVVNAAGPWVRRIIDANDLAQPETMGMRYSKGSHIIVPKLHDGDHAYLLQQPDGRIVFAIPYEGRFTLIGTTDVDYQGKPNDAAIDEDEIAYLCEAASRSFEVPVTTDQIVWTYSGVRGLLDSGDDNLSEVTRDYKLDLEESFGAPLLNVFGGKLTTFRKLSEQVLEIVMPVLGRKAQAWTRTAYLPGGAFGGDVAVTDFDGFVAQQADAYPWLDGGVLRRYARAYGSRMADIIGDAHGVSDLGQDFGDGVYEAELRYGVAVEWVRSAQDFLWRRSKLGLHISDETRGAVEVAITRYVKEAEDE